MDEADIQMHMEVKLHGCPGPTTGTAQHGGDGSNGAVGAGPSGADGATGAAAAANNSNGVARSAGLPIAPLRLDSGLQVRAPSSPHCRSRQAA